MRHGCGIALLLIHANFIYKILNCTLSALIGSLAARVKNKFVTNKYLFKYYLDNNNRSKIIFLKQ